MDSKPSSFGAKKTSKNELWKIQNEFSGQRVVTRARSKGAEVQPRPNYNVDKQFDTIMKEGTAPSRRSAQPLGRPRTPTGPVGRPRTPTGNAGRPRGRTPNKTENVSNDRSNGGGGGPIRAGTPDGMAKYMAPVGALVDTNGTERYECIILPTFAHYARASREFENTLASLETEMDTIQARIRKLEHSTIQRR